MLDLEEKAEAQRWMGRRRRGGGRRGDDSFTSTTTGDSYSGGGDFSFDPYGDYYDDDDYYSYGDDDLPLAVNRKLMVKELRNNVTKAGYKLSLPWYLIFISLYIAILLMHRDPAESFELEEAVRETLVDETRANVNIDGAEIGWNSIETVEDWYDYVESVFIPIVYLPRDDGLPLSEFTHAVLRENYLLGGWRIVLRRVKKGCEPASPRFGPFAPDCWPKLSKKTETFEPYGGDDGQLFKFETDRFGNKGFYVNFDHDREAMRKMVDTLKSEDFIDRATRQVDIHMTLYNRNLNYFLAVELRAAFGIAGFARKFVTLTPIVLEPYFDDHGRRYVEIAFVIFLVGFTIHDIARLGFAFYADHHVLHHLTFWTLLRLCHLGMCWASLGLWVKYWRNKEGRALTLPNRAEAELNKVKTDEFIDLTAVADDYNLYLRVAVITGLLFLLRLLELLQVSPKVAFLTRTFARAWPKLWPFSIMFAVVFLFFAFLGYVAFGPTQVAWQTYGRALSSSFEVITGEGGFAQIIKNGVTAALWYYVFVVLILFLLTNVFIAILADAYIELSQMNRSRAQKASSRPFSDWYGDLILIARGRKDETFQSKLLLPVIRDDPVLAKFDYLTEDMVRDAAVRANCPQLQVDLMFEYYGMPIEPSYADELDRDALSKARDESFDGSF